MHDWTMVSESIIAEAVVFASSDSVKVDSFKGILDVKTLKSGKDQMDKNAYKTLNADKYPQITFELVKVINANPDQQKLTAVFDVTIAGVTKQLEIEASAIPMDDTSVQIKGTKNMKMTDFEIKPPSFMLGALKTGDDLTVDFSMNLAVAQNTNVSTTNL